jgi:hypothetical protein
MGNTPKRERLLSRRGNDMLFFGPKLSLPPAEALTADGTKLLLMPYAPNSTTHFKVRKTPLYIYI